MAYNSATGRLEQIPTKLYPQTRQALVTPEARYWKSFKYPVLLRQYASVTSISFSGVSPYDFAVTSSTRVQIFDASTNSVKKVFSRFHDLAYSGHLRRDGHVLVAGGEEGIVRVCDVTSRMVLRSLKGHSAAVHVTSFVHSLPHILSASDDTTLRHWDMSTGTCLSTLSEHSDRVRALSISDTDSNLYISGSYDHTVKMWDGRTAKASLTLHQPAPVEAVAFLPGGSLLAVASGQQVLIWDLLKGSLLTSLDNHAKTVTSLTVGGGERSRLISASLDQHLKVYDLPSFQVVHTMKYPAPLLCVALSPSQSHIVCGMADGMLSIRHRAPDNSSSSSSSSAAMPPTPSPFDIGPPPPTGKKKPHRVEDWRYWQRGADEGAPEDAATPSSSALAPPPPPSKKARLRPHERHLARFEFKKSLDVALRTLTDPSLIGSFLEELVSRQALPIALGGRTAAGLLPLLRFLDRYITNPAFSPTLLPILDQLLNIYGPILAEEGTEELDQLLKRILKHVRGELATMEGLQILLGGIEPLLA